MDVIQWLFATRGSRVGAIIALLIFAAIVADASEQQVTVETGTVVDRSYSPSRTDIGVGPVINGHGGVAVTTTSTPESWVVIVKCNDGIYPLTCHAEQWVSLNIGSHVQVVTQRGRWSGWVYVRKFQ